MAFKIFGQKATETHRATVAPFGVEVEVGTNEVLLDVLLREGIDAPHSCQAGSCGTCRCKLVEGKVKELLDSGYVLDREEIEAGYILSCQSQPLSDVSIEFDED